MAGASEMCESRSLEGEGRARSARGGVMRQTPSLRFHPTPSRIVLRTLRVDPPPQGQGDRCFSNTLPEPGAQVDLQRDQGQTEPPRGLAALHWTTMRSYLDFEKPVAELDAKLDELRALAASGSDIGDEIARVEERASQALVDLYANLTPWQKTLV